MKITQRILKRRARQPLETTTYLDLSGLGIGAIEGLQNCWNLQILDLSHNNIEEIEGIDFCQNLWNVNFSHNELSSLTELSHFYALGTVDLSFNNLSWKDLARIQEVIILDLHLHGNPILEKDTHYRIHVIDCLPNIWMLDGRIITSAERQQVEHFFHDSALSSHPVRKKLSDQRPYTSRQKMKAGSIHGDRTSSLVSKFARNEIHSADTDLRRLTFLFENMQADLSAIPPSLNENNVSSPYLPKFCLQGIIEERQSDRERCNVLLLLLLSSLEFQLPSHLLLETLQITKLGSYADVDTSLLFTLDRCWRIRLLSLLLSASKLDRDMCVEGSGGLYDRLYLCLYYLVSDLVKTDWKNWKRKSSASQKSQNHKVYLSSYLRPQTAPPSVKDTLYTKRMDQSREEHRMLLASEIVLLLNVVPSFYKHIENDPAMQNLLQTATNNVALTNKIITIAKEARQQGGDIERLYNEISEHSLQQIERATISIRYSALQQFLFPPPRNKYMATNETRSEWKIILNTKNAYPRRPKSAILTSGEHLSSGRRRTYADMQSGSILKQSSFHNVSHDPKVALGSNILLGPQNMARVIAMPDPNIALVQMNSIPAANGSVIIQSKNEDDHYCYVDVTKLELDAHLGCWKPRGTIGDRVTLQPTTESKRRTSLSRTPDALIFDKDYGKHSGYRSGRSSRMSGKTSATPRSIPSRTGASPRPAQENPTDIPTQQTLDSPDRHEVLPTRPLSALFKEKMNLRLPVQSSDVWTEMDSQNDAEELLTLPETPEMNNFGLPEIVLGHPDAENLEISGNERGEFTGESAEVSGQQNQVELEEDGNVESNQNTERSRQLALENDGDVLDQTAGQSPAHAVDGQEDAENEQQEIDVENELENAEIESNPQEPELQAIADDDPKTDANGIKRNRASDLRRRAISARQPKHAKVVMSGTRPVSAVTRARDLRAWSHLYRGNVEMDRPESASSFQMERTEAWRSSTSSMNVVFDQKNLRSQSFGFMSVPENRRQTNFQVVALRPTPPQRPSSPSQNTPHKKPNTEEKSQPQKPPIIMNSKKDKGIKLASNWLAEGKDLHEEYKKSRVYMSPHVPGYLDGILTQHSQKKNISTSLPLTASLSTKLERLSAIRSSKQQVSPIARHLRDYLPPGIGVPDPNYTSRFSPLGDVKQLIGRYPAVSLIKPQKK